MHFEVYVILSSDDLDRPAKEVVKEYKEKGKVPADVLQRVMFDLAPFNEALEVEEEDCPECDGDGEGCEVCGGTGVVPYNPNAEWDWWDIGGRWSKKGEDIWMVGGESSPESAKKAPFAVLADGEWTCLQSRFVEQEGLRDKAQAAWDKCVEEHQGDVVVRVDCHI